MTGVQTCALPISLWLGTLEGLVYYRDGRFVSLAQAAPALRENMLQVVEDARGSLWLGTNRGLFTVARKELEMLVARPSSAPPQIRAYHIADGLRTSEFSGGNTGAGLRANDGTLWLPSIRGIVRVDPGRIRTTSSRRRSRSKASSPTIRRSISAATCRRRRPARTGSFTMRRSACWRRNASASATSSKATRQIGRAHV